MTSHSWWHAVTGKTIVHSTVSIQRLHTFSKNIVINAFINVYYYFVNVYYIYGCCVDPGATLHLCGRKTDGFAIALDKQGQKSACSIKKCRMKNSKLYIDIRGGEDE